MVRCTSLFLLGVATWSLLGGQSMPALGDGPGKSIAIAQVPFGQSSVDETPPAVPLPAYAHHNPHPSQPEEFSAHGIFSDPVACGVLVQYALANNPEIQAARFYARSLGARVPQAASLGDPQLMTTAFLESIQTAAGPQEVVVSLSQRFPWFGKRGLRSNVAYHDAMAAYARLAALELKVFEQVKRAYFDLYSLQNAITETRRLQPQLENVIEIANERYRTSAAGGGLESVLQARIELSKLKTSLIKLENASIKVQAELAGILHLPAGTRFVAVPRLDRADMTDTVQLLVELAETCQPGLDAYRREICRDRSAAELACRNYWPDVTLSFNWYEIGSDGLSAVANGHDAYSLGVGVNLPLYRTRLDAAVREAQYKTSSSLRRYTSARDQLRAEVQILHAQFTEHDQILAILELEILPRADQTFDLSVEAYRTGRLQFQQLIDAYRTLLDYRIDYHNRVAMREQAVAALERAVGCAVTATPVETAALAEHLPGPPLPE